MPNVAAINNAIQTLEETIIYEFHQHDINLMKLNQTYSAYRNALDDNQKQIAKKMSEIHTKKVQKMYALKERMIRKMFEHQIKNLQSMIENHASSKDHHQKSEETEHTNNGFNDINVPFDSSTTPSPKYNCNHTDANSNFFNQRLPHFEIANNTNTNGNHATICNMNSTAIDIIEDSLSDHSNFNESDASLESNHEMHSDKERKIKKDRKKKKKKKRKKKHKKKHREFKYKYRKDKDNDFFRRPAPARTGDTDKTWLYCNHRTFNGDGVCGVKFIRTLKDLSDKSCQHRCDGAEDHKLITRNFGGCFGGCGYEHCNDTEVCIRTATIDEIKAYQNECTELGISPNSYGGYKVKGAKETKNGKRKSYGSSPRSKSRTRSVSPKKKKKKVKSVGKRLCSMSPPATEQNGLSLKEEDHGKSHSVGCEVTNNAPLSSYDDAETVSYDENQPLKRNRKRKRKLEDIKESDSDTSSENNDGSPLKKQKVDVSRYEELHNKDLDELVSTAFANNNDLEWNVDGLWCRYCGARGSVKWLKGPWGENMLCYNHGTLYEQGEGCLEHDIDGLDEPVSIDDALYPGENTERGFLIQEIMKGSHVCVDGRRKSVRNMKKEIEDEQSSEESSSGDDVSTDDEDEPIAQRIEKMNNLDEVDSNDVSINVNENHNADNGHISDSEDDDLAIGVD